METEKTPAATNDRGKKKPWALILDPLMAEILSIHFPEVKAREMTDIEFNAAMPVGGRFK
jgi:hypothetical protein